MVITVDGPAAAGKSSVARALAKRLGFDYLDTGAFYRAATWKALQKGVDLNDPAALAQVASQLRVEFARCGDERRVLCDGRDVTEAIRTPAVTAKVRCVADGPAARKMLIELQRRYAQERNLVTEGRDQGTEVWPEADAKFYLDASLEERAARRFRDLDRLGASMTAEQVRADIEERDRRDRSRPIGHLRRTDDMVLIDSTHMSVDQVVSAMLEELARCRPDLVAGVRPRRQSGQ